MALHLCSEFEEVSREKSIVGSESSDESKIGRSLTCFQTKEDGKEARPDSDNDLIVVTLV